MKVDELRKKATLKALLRAKSGYGKTFNACKVSLNLSKKGNDVLYVDTEAEGATTMVKLIEKGEYSEEDAENVDYVQVSGYDEFMAAIGPEEHRGYDLMVVDTLDHKHTFTSRKVMEDVLDADEDDEMQPDWNVYPEIYAREREVMETLGKAKTNLLATLDPESGKMDKPKGTQVNVHGYFTAVIDLGMNGDEYTNVVKNWVLSDSTNKSVGNLPEVLTTKFEERIE